MQVVESTAEAHGCTATVAWLETPYGPTINDKGMVSMLEDVAGRVLGEGKFNRVAPGMPAEDFSFFTGTHLIRLTGMSDAWADQSADTHSPLQLCVLIRTCSHKHV